MPNQKEAPPEHSIYFVSRRAAETSFSLSPADLDGESDGQAEPWRPVYRRYGSGTQVTVTVPEFSGGNQFQRYVLELRDATFIEEHTDLTYTFTVDDAYVIRIEYQNLEDPADATALTLPIDQTGELANGLTDVHWFKVALTDDVPYYITMEDLEPNTMVQVFGPSSGSAADLDVGTLILNTTPFESPSGFHGQGSGTYYFRVSVTSNGYQHSLGRWKGASQVSNFPFAYRFQVREGVSLHANVALSGFYDGPDMRTLTPEQFPIFHPYAVPPWNVEQRRPQGHLSTVITDWILVELWADERPNSVVDVIPMVVLSTGETTDLYRGSSTPIFDAPPGEYYVAVRHRNHIDVRSAEKVTLSSTTLPTVDFTAAGTMAHGTNAMRQMPNGEWALHAGDANADCTVDASDLTDIVLTAMGATGYHAADLNHDWAVSNQDVLTAWLESNGASCAFE